MMESLKEIRVRLDQLTELTVSALKDRSRLSLNEPIYLKDAIAIEGKRGISLLDLSILSLESSQAIGGRFEYKDQHPLTEKELLPKSLVKRVVPKTDVLEMRIPIKEELVGFYRSVLPEICMAGDDPTTYWQAALKDTEILGLMNERVTGISLFVAQAKYRSNPEIYSGQIDVERLKETLRDSGRENAVVEKAVQIAARYELPQNPIEQIFRWLIEKTVDSEVIYLQALGAKNKSE
ncbi:MAG: hypothetical protein KGH71_03415 [Candidatus Micrarchaeota archaeon]|nr:hypothetical protein [Candidatus Micrarchaeota archaeon]